MTTEEMIKYDMMVDMGVCTSEELNLARNLVDGSWTEVFNRVAYVRTGYRTFDAYIESIMKEE